jgi:hypothetical protein
MECQSVRPAGRQWKTWVYSFAPSPGLSVKSARLKTFITLTGSPSEIKKVSIHRNKSNDVIVLRQNIYWRYLGWLLYGIFTLPPDVKEILKGCFKTCYTDYTISAPVFTRVASYEVHQNTEGIYLLRLLYASIHISYTFLLTSENVTSLELRMLITYSL